MTGSDKNIPAMPANIPPVKTPIKATRGFIFTLEPTIRGIRILVSRKCTVAITSSTVSAFHNSCEELKVSNIPMRFPSIAPI